MSDIGSDQGPAPLTRVPSGVPGLDVVLGGGFLQGGVYILQGAPGAGKTILGNQICFHLASQGHRIVYMTLLAETHARLLQHLRAMSFFNPSRIPEHISYMSAFASLEQGGFKGLLDLIRRELRGREASVLVVDGLVAARDPASTDRELKKFIHDLQIHADMVGCTTFLLTSASDDHVLPEHTMVDGVIELRDDLTGRRSERTLRLKKFRGSRTLRGQHSFRITEAGLTVYPRIEALYRDPPAADPGCSDRLSTGVPELDEILCGGLPGGTMTIVGGPTGSGKTTLGLHFVSQASRQEPALLFTFYETPARLLAKARSIGHPLEHLIEEGHLEIVWHPATELHLDEVAHLLLEGVARRNARRLFLDGFGGLQATALHPDRLGHLFTALSNELRARKVTTLCTSETSDVFGQEYRSPLPNVSAFFENLIFLRQVEIRSNLQRLISVLKVRDSEHDHHLRKFQITSRGLELGGLFEGTESNLTGAPRTVSRVTQKRAKKTTARRSGKKR